MNDPTNHRPSHAVVYGTPQQLAVLLASIGKLIQAEPDETFADFEVRIECRRFVRLLRQRCGHAPTWQEANPGICCACGARMAETDARRAPICTDCMTTLFDPSEDG